MLRYCQILLTIGMFAGCLFAAVDDTHTFELNWREHGIRDTIPVPMDRQEPFVKEPDLGGHDVIRGATRCFGPKNDQYGLNFILDKTERKLYVDLNCDGDLTNDPNGIIKSKEEDGHDYNFPAVPLTFTTDQGSFRYQLSAYYYDSRWQKNIYIYVDSDYSSTIELYGAKWFISANDRLNGEVKWGSQISFQPATDEKPEGYETNVISSLPVKKYLFIDGRCYQTGFEFHKTDTGDMALRCTLTEKEVPMGMLRIEGKLIERLVFGNESMLVLPPLVDKVIPAPVGNFTLESCALTNENNKRTISPQQIKTIPVTVAQEGESLFKIGAPLQNSVTVERSGSMLQFSYELKGVGGEQYNVQQILNYDYSKKPSVAIYKGDMKLAEGQFEFG